MEKVIIVINGRGGAGKDTLCGFAEEICRVSNHSSIDPIKDIARQAGWNGEKDDRSRKFLSDLKALLTEYNDLPTGFLISCCREFLDSADDVLFLHIREPEQISHFIETARREGINGRIVTLLVRRSGGHLYGNASDDNVENFPYDLIYENDKPLEEARADFLRWFGENITGAGN